MPQDPVNLRGRANFVPHSRISWPTANPALQPDNLIFRATTPDQAWIEEATSRIGDWRSLSRSVYLRWALTINASAMAEQRYRSLPETQALRTDAMRVTDGRPEQVTLALWPAPEAADKYAQVTPLIAASGISDQFGALEDILFDFYEIVLRHNPRPLMQGIEYQNIRRLWREREQSQDQMKAWMAAWKERFDKWRRKRGYDGLHQVFSALYRDSGLRRPIHYHHTDINDWANTIQMIAELRNLIVHGAATVSPTLADLSNTRTSLTFDFTAGAQLEVKLHHLQSVECFCEQLLSAINLSLMEKALGPLGNWGAPPATA